MLFVIPAMDKQNRQTHFTPSVWCSKLECRRVVKNQTEN